MSSRAVQDGQGPSSSGTIASAPLAGPEVLRVAREHVVIHDQCIAPAEQLGETHPLWRSVVPHVIEDVVLRDFATVRKLTPLSRHRFHLASQGQFGLEQAVARGAVFRGFIGKAHVRTHVS
jgi:hypothetical protein